MYEVATLDGDYTIETFETLEQAQDYARNLVNSGVLVGCRVYLVDGRYEVVSPF